MSTAIENLTSLDSGVYFCHLIWSHFGLLLFLWGYFLSPTNDRINSESNCQFKITKLSVYSKTLYISWHFYFFQFSSKVHENDHQKHFFENFLQQTSKGIRRNFATKNVSKKKVDQLFTEKNSQLLYIYLVKKLLNQA